MSDLLDAALGYCQCGLSVLAWKYQERAGKFDKVPTHPWKVGVVPRATEETIRQLWTRDPDANVGVITGLVSNLVVVDADTPEAEAWCLANLPSTPWQVTTGRGRHFGYQYPDLGEGEYIRTGAHLGCRHKNKSADDPLHKGCFAEGAICGLDIRADKGYASMPPSLHKTGRHYEWDTTADDLSDLLKGMPVFSTSWLPDLSIDKENDQTTKEGLLDWSAPGTGDTSHAEAWVALQPPAISNQGGRNQTFKVAAKLIRDYALAPSQALAILKVYNNRCQPPWSESELRGKIEDAWLKGSSPVGASSAPDITEMLGEAVSGPKTGASVLSAAAQRLKVATAPTTPASVEQLSADDDFVQKLCASAARDAGAPYEPVNIAHAARLSRDNKPAFSRLDQALSGLINKVTWKAEIRRLREAAQAASSTHALRADTRTEVPIGDARASRDLILGALRQCSGIYVSSGKLSFADKSAKMVELHSGALRNLIVDNCSIVNIHTNEDSGISVSKPASLPADVLSMLEGLLPEQIEPFRIVNQVTKAPFFNRSGKLVATSGYDEESKTLLVDAPSGIDPQMFATSDEAIDYLYGVFYEFKFQTMAEFANYLGALLTPMIRPMYSGPTPWVIIEANTPGSGKTLLADCVQIIYGYTPTRHVLSYKEEEIEKKMLTILQATQPIVLFDNVKHAVDSPTLEAIATSGDEYQGRLLGRNEDRICPVRQLFIITSNNATMSVDAARRFIRVRLCRTGPSTTTTGDQHQFAIKDLRAHVGAVRHQILSALVRLVQDWLDAGRPVPSSVPLLPSFEVFCEHVGSVLHHAGRTDWLANFEEAKRAFSVNDDWGTFLAIWFEEFKTTEQTDNNLLALVQRHGLLSGLLSKATDSSAKLAIFKRNLNNLRDYDDGTFKVNVILKSNTKTVYSLEKEASDGK